MQYPRIWEKIDNDTHRLRVHEGWLVTHDISIDFTSMVFVPDKDNRWDLEPEQQTESKL